LPKFFKHPTSEVIAITMPEGSISVDEYERRLRAVQRLALRGGLDAVIVTAQRHIQYLIGTSCNSLSSPWPSPLIVPVDGRPTYIVRRYDERRVAVQAPTIPIVSYFGDEAVELWAGALQQHGLAAARVGFELDRADLTPVSVTRLRRMLPAMEFVDSSAFVNTVMDVKSSEELALLERIAALNAVGYSAFISSLVAGVSEQQVNHAVVGALMAAGSALPHVEAVLGLNTGMPHAGYSPTASTLLEATPAFIEFSAEIAGYSSGLVRTALLGRDLEIERLHGIAERALAAVAASLRPGARGRDVDQAARTVVSDAGYGDSFRHRTGYSLNILWGPYGASTGSVDLSPESDTVLEENMVFHTPINLFAGTRFGIGCSESWIVTSDGCRPLGSVPRTLHLLG
jgi:Xaa-Pro dipeptidase